MTVAEFQQHLKDALAASHYLATDAKIVSGTVYEDGPVIQLAHDDKSHTQFMVKYLDPDVNQWCNIMTIFGTVKIIKYETEKGEEVSCDIAEREEESCAEEFA